MHFSLSLQEAKYTYREIKGHLRQNETTLRHHIFITGATQALSRHQPLSHPSFKYCYFPPCVQSTHTHTQMPSVCNPAVHRSSLPQSCCPLSFHSVRAFCLKKFLLHACDIFCGESYIFMTSLPSVCSSASPLTDYLLCFPLILIRGFHSEHQKASWRSSIMGRTPQK